MRVLVGLAVLGMLAAACTPAGNSSAPETQPPRITYVLTAPPQTTTTTTPDPVSIVDGTLLDGSRYTVIVEPSQVEGISGAVMIVLPNGGARAAGILRVSDTEEAEVSLIGTRLSLPTAGQTVTLEIYDEVLQFLAPDAEQTLFDGIRPNPGARLPALELSPPFRWAADDELPLQMGVQYGLFDVRRGCNDILAVACSATRAVQVIPADRLYAGDSVQEWPADITVWIDSDAPRPITDAFYLDPGPLSPRANHSVMWTGSEMIVWGGSTTDGPPELVDGAAFDPATDTWRVLPDSPLRPGLVNRALWADNRMIVVGVGLTAEYRPDTNAWRVIGDGLSLAASPRLMAWAGNRVVVLNANGLLELHEGTGAWVAIEGPGFGNDDPWNTSLLVVDDRLAVSALRSGNCSGRRFAVQSDSGWDELPDVSLATAALADCSYPHQAAWVGERLVIWDSEEHPAFAFDFDTRQWRETQSITLSSQEGPDGPVAMGDRFIVPQFGVGAIYDPVGERWTSVKLPGDGLSNDMVWTGTEVLMWGSACCFGVVPSGNFTNDAWRWRPPMAPPDVGVGEIDCASIADVIGDSFDLAELRCVARLRLNGDLELVLIQSTGSIRTIGFGANSVLVDDIETATFTDFDNVVFEVTIEGGLYVVAGGRREVVLPAG